MKTEIIVKKLDEALKGNDILAMYRLLEDLKKEAYIETKGFTASEKRAYNAVLRFLKNAGSVRYCFGKASVQCIGGVDYQIFTDSHCAFYLKNHYDLPKAVGNYPYMGKFITSDPGVLCEVDVEDVLKKMKSHLLPCIQNPGEKPLYVVIIGEGDKTCYINADIFKTVVTILNEKKLTFYSNGPIDPVIVADEKTGNKAVMMGMRIDERKLKSVE